MHLSSKQMKKYVEELHNKDEKPNTIDIGKECNKDKDQGQDLVRKAILRALKEMKTNKAEPPNNVTVKILKCVDGKAIYTFTITIIYNND